MRSERSIVACLSVIGALRVLVLCAAFPFFNNVDEALHFDTVMRYASGRVPTRNGPLAEETLSYIARYASPEFLSKRAAFPNQRFPSPLWKQSPSDAEPIITATANAWRAVRNFELSQPPLYYAAAALWLDLARLAGISGLLALYWVRFLNALVLAGTVWLGYTAARMVSPASPTVRIGVPLLLAFFPQAIFFSIENDVLSSLVCAAAFVIALRAETTMKKGGAIIAGLVFAAAYLTKLSNMPFVIIAAIVVFARQLQAKRNRVVLVLVVAAAAAPVAAWVWWSKMHFGGVTGSAEKVATLGWHRKPTDEWLTHPLFSLSGLWTFLSDLLATYWRGELSWEGETLRSSAADLFYAVSSIALTFVGTIFGMRKADRAERRAVWLSASWLIAGVGFLALLSLPFDFGRSVYPSRDFPYFTSGRLIAGTLVPFALLYVRGIEALLGRWNRGLPLIALAVIVVFVTVSAISVDAPAFASEHNLFHR